MTTPPAPRPPGPGRRLDWSEVHSRLASAAAATEAATDLSPERAAAVMDERARVLARVPERMPGPSEVVEVALFTLAGARYAVETRYISKVVRLTDFTPVPGTPGFLGGLLNLRGEILALVDLRAFFGIPASGLTDLSRILVLGVERNEFGIMADAVQEVITLRIDAVLEPPASIPGAGRPFLMGVTVEGLVVLDGGALIGDEDLFVDQGDESGTSSSGWVMDFG